MDDQARCEICGGEDCAGAALSWLQLIFGYGSKSDGELLELTMQFTHTRLPAPMPRQAVSMLGSSPF